MSDVNVELEAGRWIKKTVQAALGSKISGAYLDMIPESKRLPAVRYQAQRRNDVQTVAGHIVLSRILFMVVVTAQGEDMDSLVSLSGKMHSALHRARGTTNLARILQCTRMETYGATETEAADTFRHAGGMYEIFVQADPPSEG